jgi:hypothetical protein
MKNRFFAFFAFLVAFCASTALPATAAARYTVVDLGFFDGTSINNAGEAVGVGPSPFFGVDYAYLWNGTFHSLGSLVVGATVNSGFKSSAVRIDSNGRVYGTSEYEHALNGFISSSAFVWDGKMHGVPFPNGLFSCNATGANDIGDVVGYCFISPSNFRSYVYTGRVSRLFAPIGWEIQDITTSGEILILDRTGGAHLFSHGAYKALKKTFAASRLDNAGIVAGSHAVYFNGAKYVDLGILSGFAYTNLSIINANGAAVGTANDGSGNQRAVYYDPSLGIVDLNDAIAPGQGFTLDEGIDINDNGQILALGGPHGASNTYILTPTGGAGPAHRPGHVRISAPQ